MGSNPTKENKAKEIKRHIRDGSTPDEIETMTSQLRQTSQEDLKGILHGLRFKVLQDAIKTGDVVVLLKLINDGFVKLNEGLGETKLTPLHLAAYACSPEILRALLSYPDSDLNMCDIDGDTPLMFAIHAAETDAQAVVNCGILISDPRCNIGQKNLKGSFPLLISLKKGFKETSGLLLTKPRLKAYTSEDFLICIKLAMTFDQEELADMIIERLDKTTWLAIVATLSEDPRMTELKSMLESQLDLLGENGINSQKSTSNDDQTVPDSMGNDLRNGCSVRILGLETLKRENAKDKIIFLEKIAHKLAIIQEVTGSSVVVKLTDEKVIGKITSTSVIFLDSGPRQSLADGTDVGVGSFAKVFADETTLKRLTGGHGGWNEEMVNTCGKTGRVLEIDKESDVLVCFAWGKAYFFNPHSLLPSSSECVETLDSNRNWLSKGSPALVTESKETFIELQTKNRLPSDFKHQGLIGKYVSVQRAIITPYTKDKDVVAFNNKQPYGVNADCLTLVSFATDHDGKVMKVGSKVKMLNNKSIVEKLQTEEFGGWAESIEKVLGLPGNIISLDVNAKFDPTDVVVQVKFNNGMSYYINPKTVIYQQEDTPPRKVKEFKVSPPKEAVVSCPPSIANRENTRLKEDLQEISRKDLRCSRKLGEGAFGCVTVGSWKGTDCAIKQIKLIVTSQIDYEEILKEAKIHFSLKHPNIVQLYGISYDIDLWMVMQLVQGVDLHSIIFPLDKTKDELVVKKLNYEEKIKIALQISNGISYIHEKGFLHGDIKPQNIIFDVASKNTFICDFGISRFLGNLDLNTFVTKYTKTFGGTMYYVAPECLKTDSESGQRYRKPTFKADIWSLAAVFYELFTEKCLFKDQKSLALCKFCDVNIDIKKSIECVDISVRDLIDRGLELDHVLRPTAQEMSQYFLTIYK